MQNMKMMMMMRMTSPPITEATNRLTGSFVSGDDNVNLLGSKQTQQRTYISLYLDFLYMVASIYITYTFIMYIYFIYIYT